MGWVGLLIVIVIALAVLLIVLGYDDTIRFIEALFQKGENIIKDGAAKVIDEP